MIFTLLVTLGVLGALAALVAGLRRPPCLELDWVCDRLCMARRNHPGPHVWANVDLVDAVTRPRR